jgi:hypothetical protein
MKRSLCWLAVLGIAVLPDWASAYHPCYAPPPPCGSFGPPAYHQPPVVLVVPVYVPVAPATSAAPLPSPRVFTETTPPPVRPAPPAVKPDAVATPAPKPPEFRPSNPPRTATPPAVSPFAAPTPAPAPPPEASPMSQAESVKPTAATEPPAPAKSAEPAPNPFRGGVPPAAPTDAKLPPLEPPVLPVVPPPTPTTVAPATGAIIPPTNPILPTGPNLDLPPLTLPPESSAPASAPPTVSKSSPLAAAVKVKLLPAAGKPAAGPTRQVGFFNHTDRDLDLVIQGKAVALPRKTYVYAEVPPSFAWKHGGNPTQTETVPAGAAGLDVVFQE